MKQAVKEPLSPAMLKAALNDTYHQDEAAALAALLPLATLDDAAKTRVRATARGLIQTVRDNRKKFGGLDRFLNEFGLTTREGIALMCLAEALLRIPDRATADKMIRDKIGSADWDQHLGKADDLFVNASTWALMLTGKVVADVEEDNSLSVSSIAGKIVSRLGEPVVRQAMMHAMKIMGQQFVMGRTIGEALLNAEDNEKLGYRYSYDMLGEGARTMEDAARYFASYDMAIHAIGKAAASRGVLQSPGISVKLSALYPRFEYARREECVPFLTEKLLQLAQKCAQFDISLTVDAEEANRLETSLDIIEAVFTDPALKKDWAGFGLAVQAYQKRCPALIDWLVALARQTGRRMMIRLVKGAYWDSEIKYAQMNGLPGYPVYTRKNATDVSYVANAAKLLASRDAVYPMFATHNAYTVACVMEMAGGDKGGFEFQRLHGMGDALYHQIVGNGAGKYPCRVYAPVGSHQDLLPYLVRRLLENGANTNFVNRLQNDSVPIDEMLTDPADHIAAVGGKPHPKIPLPADLYGASRKNSKGVEFANGAVSIPLLRQVEAAAAKTYTAAPLVNGMTRIGSNKQKTFDPADLSRETGTVSFATAEDIALGISTAQAGFAKWNATPAHDRAACLERTADLMEENMAELMALCVREAGKTLPDAVAEVREAVDFCRYYAVEGRHHFGAPMTLPGPTGEANTLLLEGRGVFLCISPWNFPLAIFMGQVAAALMAGNTVIAKPAEQTCLIAQKAVELLIKAGVPKDAITFLPATGEMTGAHMVPDARIAGVCFTGSTEVAKIINRTLAAREGAIAPLIAETGGQNAMIADSSALPEQVVDDVITSAFRSAGQRCSALRVLYLQDVIADKVIAMLDGACKMLTLDDPLKLSTDIGPVIDDAALSMLATHAARMDREAKRVAEVPAHAEAPHGHFFAPRAYEIDSIRRLTGEVFGPILHIIRFKADELPKVVEEINSTGFGLTFGVHTRIDHTMKKLCGQVRAGNCYANRSMIGAVVGVQPFGGQGLSGTGPKAGGPHYLPRFATERTVTINTTASGGNTTLVSLAED
jgi:RHH-type proline utilization regulon transcriptional repressor/proline dehydrogenase/delta 1-pyrroline-5-carboxylate dehydrogenase